MKTKSRECDVFLSYSLEDRPVADKVTRALTQGELEVFDLSKLSGAVSISNEIRNAIANSDAIVVILPEDGTLSPNAAIELGAAMAWKKPVYLIQIANGRTRIPSFLKGSAVYPLSRVDDAVRDIQRTRSVDILPDQHRSVLKSLYEEMGTPLDQYIGSPELLDELAKRFKERTKSGVPGERLLAEIVRLRKGRDLPRLKRTKAAPSSS